MFISNTLLDAEVWLVVVVAWLARETRVASDANLREVILDLCVVIISIEAEEVTEAFEVVHARGAGGACFCLSRSVPHAHVSQCLPCC
jgi:hypothetical protein